MRFSTMLLFALLLLFVAPVLAVDDMPSADDLPAGEWTTIATGGETSCAMGTPYEFHVRPAETESNQLLIFFNGGGACWDGATCSHDHLGTYTPTVDVANDPTPTGIFNYDNDANPFQDYHAVFLPYCTGDVHIGDSVQDYSLPDSDETITIYHKGYINSMTVLDWVFDNVEAPETVFVTGSSAGAIPSPFYAEFVAEAYPEARIEVLGDGAGGYRIPTMPERIESWGTIDILTERYPENAEEIFSFELFYQVVGEAFPDISMTQYNTAADETQVSFLFLNDVVGTPLLELLEQNFADILEVDDDFAYFTAGGDLHTILRLPEFYTYTVGDVTVRDWVAALAAGEEVETVACEDCEEAETLDADE